MDIKAERIGNRVADLGHLIRLARERKSIICPRTHCFSKNIPASAAINWSAAQVHRLILDGMYVYVPRKVGKC